MTNYVERANWPDVRVALAAYRAGEKVDFNQAFRRYLLAPDAAPGQTALDACCGSGQGALILQAKGYEVYAFDKSEAALELLIGAGIHYTRKVFAHYIPPVPFDLIACCDALEHVPDPADALARFARWIKPGGMLHVSIPLEEGVSPNPFHINTWTADSVRALLAEHWRVERILSQTKGQLWAQCRLGS